jgi:hypothetical protein
MKLSAWLKEHDLTHKGFLDKSRDYGASFSIHALNKWCNGSRIPRSTEMEAIHKITDGAVRPNDFYKINN